MPAAASIDEFLDMVRKSGVTDEKRLDAYLRTLQAAGGEPGEPAKLAAMLVRDALLTNFQAECILNGRWRRFTLGKYKVLERIGRGGMGQVFLCEHKLMRRRVAIKVLPSSKAQDEAARERFYREARAAAALDHPNIAHAYDVDQDGQFHFLVMEYVDGTNLYDLVQKTGPLEISTACHYVSLAAYALDHAQQHGVVHRDIKPGNILVDRAGEVKVLDMGLARFFNDEADNLTKKFEENVLGTADYLAPEQAIDSHTVDIRGDIYSLGATLYFLLTGETPFGEGTVTQKLLWHVNRRPRPITRLREDVPPELEAVILKMLAKDPADRYQMPAAVAEALSPFTHYPVPPPPPEAMPILSPAAALSEAGPPTPGPATPPSGNWKAPPPKSPVPAAAPAVAAQPSMAPEAIIPPNLEIAPCEGDAAADTAAPSAMTDTHSEIPSPDSSSLRPDSSGTKPDSSAIKNANVASASGSASTSIVVRCVCGSRLKLKADFAGRTVTCPACAKSLRVPDAAQEGVQEKSRPPATPPPQIIQKPAPRPTRAEEHPPSERDLRTASRRPRDHEGYDRDERRSRKPEKGRRKKASLFASLLGGNNALLLGVIGFLGLGAAVGLYVILGIREAPVNVASAKKDKDKEQSKGRVPDASTPKTEEASVITHRAVDRNLKQVCAGMKSFNEIYHQLPPPGYSKDFLKADSKPLLSWRVALLPFLDEAALYREFRLNEPWDSPTNIKLLPKMPKVFQALGAQTKKEGYTYVQLVTGPGTAFPTPTTKAVIPDSFPDGPSTTILIVEGAEPVPWTKPADFSIDVRNVTNAYVPKLGAISAKGFYAGLADGTVRFIDRTRTSDRSISQAFNPADGQAMGPDW